MGVNAMRWMSAFLFSIPVIAGAQPLLDFRNDLAFRPQAVDTFAERAYRERLDELEAAGNLDADRALLDRIHHIVACLRPAAVYECPPPGPFHGRSTFAASATRMLPQWREGGSLSERNLLRRSPRPTASWHTSLRTRWRTCLPSIRANSRPQRAFSSAMASTENLLRRMI